MSTDAGRRFVFLLVNTVGRSRRGDAYERWSVCGFDTALWEEQLGENVFFLLFICLFVYESNGNSFKTNSLVKALVGACAAVSSFLYPSSLLVDLL